MPNAASSIPSDRETLNPLRHDGDRDEDLESPGGEDGWSGAESYSNEQGERNGSQNGSRGLKRKRPVTVSCELCKQRKVKCDRAQPSCGWCSRNGQHCEYRERKKPGLRAGYGRELEQRLDRLEEIINSQARLIETHIVHNQPRHSGEFSHDGGTGPGIGGSGGAHSYSSPSEPSAAHGPSPRTALFLQEPPPMSNFTGHQGQRISIINQEPPPLASPVDPVGPVSAQNGSRPRIQGGITSAAAGMSSTPETPPGNEFSRNDSSLNVPVNIFSNQERSLTDPDLDLPPYDLLYALVDLYFEHINTWCPMLHRRTTLDALFGPSPLDEADRILLYAIVATTLRFSTDPRLNDDNRKRYHDSSKQKVLLYGLENSSVTALQALVILALDLVGSSNGPPGWKLLALIARSVVQLGLAVESTSSLYSSVYPSIYTLRAVVLPEPSNWIEDESRRRLFWIMYLLDRYATIATAFDFALDEKDIDRKLPCKDEFFSRNQQVETRWFHPSDRADYINQPENVGSFGFYVEILGILSRVHMFLKNPVDIGALSDVEEWQATYRKLDNELTSWEFNLPNEYAHENSSRLFNATKANKTVHCGWVMLHATYQTAVIRLHSSAAYPTTRSPIFTPSYSASQRCLVAVDNILSLTRFVLENNMLDKLGPPFAFTLWVSARLLLVHGSTIAHTVSPDFLFFVNTLAQMGKIWKVAERYSTILRRVLDEYGEYEQSIGTMGERVTPSTVKILADMRRCAFDLDFLISRQPKPAVPEFQSDAMAAAAAAGGMPPSMPARNPPAQNELEYLDVFGFFNVPRLPPPSAHQQQLNGSNNVAGNNDKNEAGGNNLSVHDAINAAAAAEQGSGSMVNEFNITNYLIPTPETDWLFRASN